MPLDAHKIANYELADVKLYLVERKQKGRDVRFEASIQPQTSFVEAIPAEQTFQADLHFNIEFLFAIKNRLHANKDEIISDRQRYWIGIAKKVNALFHLDIQTLTKDNLEEKRRAVEAHLLECIAKFSRLQLEQYETWFEHFQRNDTKKGELSESVREGWQPVLERQTRRLLHVGYATGFQGTTALLYFLQDKKRQVLFEAVMTLFRIGDKPGSKSRDGKPYQANISRFPKSRRLVRTTAEARPMGWIEMLQAGEQAASVVTAKATAVKVAAVAEYYNQPLDPKKPPLLDAVVIKSGRPNLAAVYLSPDNKPQLNLNNYRNPLEVGTIVQVQPTVSKTGKVVEIAFRKVKD